MVTCFEYFLNLKDFDIWDANMTCALVQECPVLAIVYYVCVSFAFGCLVGYFGSTRTSRAGQLR